MLARFACCWAEVAPARASLPVMTGGTLSIGTGHALSLGEICHKGGAFAMAQHAKEQQKSDKIATFLIAGIAMAGMGIVLGVVLLIGP